MSTIFNLKDYGAVGNGRTHDTKAFQKTIDACTACGGGTVLVPAGGRFLVGQIELRDNVTLHLEEGSEIISTWGKNDFPSGGVIHAKDVRNISITGHGTINGSGRKFVKEELPHIYRCVDWRPHTVRFINCRNLRFENFTLRDSAQWAFHVAGCYDVLFMGISIYNDLRMPNSDGIDPDNCRNVRISDCHIESGDDAICLKSSEICAEMGPCENIAISNCTLVSTSCAIKLGSSSVVGIRDMVVSNCVIKASNRGLGIQLRDGGDMENIIFTNCIIETRLFHDDWWGKAEPIYITAIPRSNGAPVGNVRNVRFSNILCRGENGVFIQGTKGRNIEDVEFDGVQIEVIAPDKYKGGVYDRRPCGKNEFLRHETVGFYIENARRIELRNSQVRWTGFKKPGRNIKLISCSETSKKV